MKLNQYKNKKNGITHLLIKEKIYLVDTEDVNRLKNYYWHVCSKRLYLRTMKKEKEKLYTLLMHRFITNCPPDKIVDHINRNIFDNRKENLRITNNSINAYNKVSYPKSGYRGVSYNKRDKYWRAEIKYAPLKIKKIKQFKSIEEAIQCRKKWEKELELLIY